MAKQKGGIDKHKTGKRIRGSNFLDRRILSSSLSRVPELSHGIEALQRNSLWRVFSSRHQRHVLKVAINGCSWGWWCARQKTCINLSVASSLGSSKPGFASPATDDSHDANAKNGIDADRGNAN